MWPSRKRRQRFCFKEDAFFFIYIQKIEILVYSCDFEVVTLARQKLHRNRLCKRAFITMRKHRSSSERKTTPIRRGGRGGRLPFGGKSVGRHGHVKEVYPGTLDVVFLAIVFMFLLCGGLFSFLRLFWQLDIEYRLQWSNLLINEDVGGRRRAAGAAGGFVKGRIFSF